MGKGDGTGELRRVEGCGRLRHSERTDKKCEPSRGVYWRPLISLPIRRETISRAAKGLVSKSVGRGGGEKD